MVVVELMSVFYLLFLFHRSIPESGDQRVLQSRSFVAEKFFWTFSVSLFHGILRASSSPNDQAPLRPYCEFANSVVYFFFHLGGWLEAGREEPWIRS